MVDIDVRVSRNWTVVAARLRRAPKELRKEVRAGLRQAVDPLSDAIRDGIPQYMPRRGGYAALLGGALSLRTTVTGSGVRITGTSSHDIRARQRGSLRHPVYGHDRWVNQAVRPGFFTEPPKDHMGEVRDAMIPVLDAFARKIAG
jgi:hypothetical protein